MIKIGKNHGFGLSLGLFASCILLAAAPFASTAFTTSSSDFVEAATGQSVADHPLLGEESTEISLIFLGDASPWEMSPLDSPTTKQGTLQVMGEGPWQISISSDMDGYMSEYNDSEGYLLCGRRLSAPMTVMAQGGNRVDLSLGGVLIQGSGDMSIPITFEQPVAWNDVPLLEGHVYRSLITFTAKRY